MQFDQVPDVVTSNSIEISHESVPNEEIEKPPKLRPCQVFLHNLKDENRDARLKGVISGDFERSPSIHVNDFHEIP